MLITIGNKALSAKPKDVVPWQNPDNYELEDISIEEFAAKAGTGHCWRAAIYKDQARSFKKSNAQFVQVLALDFDHINTSPHEIAEYAESLGIPCNFVYPSFSMDEDIWLNKSSKSATETPTIVREYNNSRGQGGKNDKKYDDEGSYNFRMVWCLEKLDYPKDAEEILDSLIYAFRKYNPDAACRDISRLWFGGKLGHIMFNADPIPVKSFCGIITDFRKGDSNKKIRDIYRKKSFAIEEYMEDFDANEQVKVEADWIARVAPYSALLQKWIDGERLEYSQRRALWANAAHLGHDSKKQTISNDLWFYYNPEVYSGSWGIEEIVKGLREKSYLPPRIVNYNGQRMTFAEFFKSNVGKHIVREDQGEITLEEMDRLQEELMPQFLSAKENRMYVSPCASGKTEHVIRFLKEFNFFNSSVIYAAPTHQNLKEFEERFIAAGGSSDCVFRSPKSEISETDLKRFSLGLGRETPDPEWREFMNLLKSDETNGLFLVTHSLISRVNDFPAKVANIVIDENIEQALVTSTKVSVASLIPLAMFIDNDKARNDFFNWTCGIKKLERGEVIDLSPMQVLFDAIYDHFEEFMEQDNLPEGLFNLKGTGVKGFDKNRNHIIRVTHKSDLLPNCHYSNIPVKMMTATPTSAYLNSYFGDTMNLDESVVIPQTKQTGKVIQYRGVTGARGNGNAKVREDIIPYMKKKLTQEQIDDLIVLSFKDTDEAFMRAGFTVASFDEEMSKVTVKIDIDALGKMQKQIHLQNSAGLDLLKGKNIAVVGKFDYPDDWYLDIYEDLHPNGFPYTYPTKTNQKVLINGIPHTLFLWDDPTLRSIQLEMMQKVQEQAIGRARTLRTDATVHLFSNLVSPLATEIYD